MASWASRRPKNARRITLSLTDELKNTLVRTKALTGKSFSFQLHEALRGLPQVGPAATRQAAVVPSPYQPTKPVLPVGTVNKYLAAGMREQKIPPPNMPWKIN